MRSDSETISRLIAYFNADDWPPFVNVEKLSERSTVVRDPDFPGANIVKIERHRAITGTRYVKNAPMSAFATYFMCFAVNDEDGQVKQLPDEPGSIEVDVHHLVRSHVNLDTVSIEIEHLADGKYKLCELVSKQYEIVQSLEQAAAFEQKIATDISDFIVQLLALDGLQNSANFDNLKDAVLASANRQVHDLIARAWDKRA